MNTKTMTKRQALAVYKETYDNFKLALKQDFIAVKTDWDCFTDMLCKDGQITDKQYNTWLFPFKRKVG